MSSKAKNISKNGIVLRFPKEMYTTPWGTLVLSTYMMSTDRPRISTIINKWKKFIKSDKVPTLDNEKFIDITLGFFNLDAKGLPIAMVVSKENTLFAPFIDGLVYPIREDGIKTRTLLSGKIYPIEWEEGI